jgi:hypothetical protein
VLESRAAAADAVAAEEASIPADGVDVQAVVQPPAAGPQIPATMGPSFPTAASASAAYPELPGYEDAESAYPPLPGYDDAESAYPPLPGYDDDDDDNDDAADNGAADNGNNDNVADNLAHPMMDADVPAEPYFTREDTPEDSDADVLPILGNDGGKGPRRGDDDGGDLADSDVEAEALDLGAEDDFGPIGADGGRGDAGYGEALKSLVREDFDTDADWETHLAKLEAAKKAARDEAKALRDKNKGKKRRWAVAAALSAGADGEVLGAGAPADPAALAEREERKDAKKLKKILETYKGAI